MDLVCDCLTTVVLLGDGLFCFVLQVVLPRLKKSMTSSTQLNERLGRTQGALLGAVKCSSDFNYHCDSLQR